MTLIVRYHCQEIWRLLRSLLLPIGVNLLLVLFSIDKRKATILRLLRYQIGRLVVDQEHQCVLLILKILSDDHRMNVSRLVLLDHRTLTVRMVRDGLHHVAHVHMKEQQEVHHLHLPGRTFVPVVVVNLKDSGVQEVVGHLHNLPIAFMTNLEWIDR